MTIAGQIRLLLKALEPWAAANAGSVKVANDKPHLFQLLGASPGVPIHIRAERETICASCEENLSGRCRKCGCGVRAQWIRKTHLATERCPLEPPKWTEWR